MMFGVHNLRRVPAWRSDGAVEAGLGVTSVYNDGQGSHTTGVYTCSSNLTA